MTRAGLVHGLMVGETSSHLIKKDRQIWGLRSLGKHAVHGKQVRLNRSNQLQPVLDRAWKGALVGNDGTPPRLQSNLHDEPAYSAPSPSQVEVELVGEH